MKRVLRFLLLGLIVVLSGFGYAYLAKPERPKAAFQEIDYVVNGADADGKPMASVSYTNSASGWEQHTVSLPWRLSVSLPHGELATLSATAHNEGMHQVKVSIYLNGEEAKTADSSGPYSTASVVLPVP